MFAARHAEDEAWLAEQKAKPLAPRSLGGKAAKPPSVHFYRLEISGGHSGSGHLFRSALAGTLPEIEQLLRDELSDPQSLAFVVGEQGRLSLELLETDSREASGTSIRP